jgi:poly(ADP-ribose) glycohydrolase ARH3
LGKDPLREIVASELGTGASSVESVSVSIYSFLANRDFKSAVTFAVNLGGDSDTIGVMTGAIAGACYGIEGIPSQWRETVENREYIEQLAKKLWEVKMGISKPPANSSVGTVAQAGS